MTDPEVPYRVTLGKFGRWIIINARDPELAWSGSCWVEHVDGYGIRIQVTNWETEEAAAAAALEVWGR